jgi:hypothetical protein
VELAELVRVVVEVVRFAILESGLDPLLELLVEPGFVGDVPFSIGKAIFLFEVVGDPNELAIVLA